MTYPSVPLTNPWVTGFVNATTMFNNTTLPLNEIQAVFVNQGAGSIGQTVLGSTVSGISTNTVAVSLTVNMVAGRKYMGVAYFAGVTTGSGIPNVQFVNPVGAGYIMEFEAVSGGVTLYGSTFAYYAPGSTGSGTWTIQATISANTMSVATGSNIMVIDCGTA